jgi:hypothetical protein
LDPLLVFITTGIHFIIHIGIALGTVIGGLVRIITGTDRFSIGITGIITNQRILIENPGEVEQPLFIIILTEEEVI